MTVPKHLEEAVGRLKAASQLIEGIREQPPTHANLAAWLAALTDFAMAQADIQAFGNESVHEKLHQLADAMQLKLG
jgi:hypothetical protein